MIDYSLKQSNSEISNSNVISNTYLTNQKRVNNISSFVDENKNIFIKQENFIHKFLPCYYSSTSNKHSNSELNIKSYNELSQNTEKSFTPNIIPPQIIRHNDQKLKNISQEEINMIQERIKGDVVKNYHRKINRFSDTIDKDYENFLKKLYHNSQKYVDTSLKSIMAKQKLDDNQSKQLKIRDDSAEIKYYRKIIKSHFKKNNQ